jgi:hypothetical protein
MRGTLVAVLVLCGAQVARAEDNIEKARAYFQAGVDAYDSGKYEVAMREFQHSHALSHNPALYFNMAACEEHLNHYQAAALLLRQYLIERPDADDKTKVETRIKSLEERDDSMKRLNEPPPTPVAPVQQPVVTAPPPPPAKKRVISWAMLGVTGALGIGAIAAGSYSVVHHDDLKSTCGMTPAGCSQDQIDGLRSATIATDVLIGLTAASAVVTVVLFIVEPKLGRKTERAKLQLTPTGLVF